MWQCWGEHKSLWPNGHTARDPGHDMFLSSTSQWQGKVGAKNANEDAVSDSSCWSQKCLKPNVATSEAQNQYSVWFQSPFSVGLQPLTWIINDPALPHSTGHLTHFSGFAGWCLAVLYVYRRYCARHALWAALVTLCHHQKLEEVTCPFLASTPELPLFLVWA